ncbi:MAG: hypothetical protein AAFZ01_04280 [Pseudomonadota bacterium]
MTDKMHAATRCDVSGIAQGEQCARDNAAAIRKTVLHTTRLSDRLQTVADQAGGGHDGRAHDLDVAAQAARSGNTGATDAQTRDAIIDALSQKIHRMMEPDAPPQNSSAHGPAQHRPSHSGQDTLRERADPAALRTPYPAEQPMFAPRAALPGPTTQSSSAPPLASFHPQRYPETAVSAEYDGTGDAHASEQSTAILIPQSLPRAGHEGLADARDEMPEWLSRSNDDDLDAPRRGNTLMLCLGTMFLSILAGYGGAQFLKHSTGALGTGASPFDEVRQASASLGFGHTASDAAIDDAPRRRTLPAAGLVSDIGQGEASAPGDASANSDQVFATATSASVERDDATPAEMEALLEARRETTEPSKNTLELSALASGNDTQVAEKKPSRPATNITPETADRLMTRASRLLQSGDVAAARLILRHVAETGSGPAALMLAHAHDETWLDANTPGSVPGNRDMAARWYAMARERGVSDAARYLAALQARQ